MPLSDSKLRGVRATGKRFELPDRDGLVLRVGCQRQHDLDIDLHGAWGQGRRPEYG